MADRPSDEILAQKAKEGDIAAFEELFDRHKRHILNFVYRMLGNMETAEEVTQETFLKAYNNLDIFDPNKKFTTWIYTIARNLSKNALRDKKYFRDISLEQIVFSENDVIRLKDVIADPNMGPDEIAEDEELSDEAQKVLDSLPPDYREIIALCGIQNLTHEQAAAIIGCSIANISIKLKEAKSLFMKRLGINIRGRSEGSDNR